ncbi:MAG: class I SAM-dependent methyltransferase [Chloroflexota bacterium]|nr:class I SAM-dependent methyltransferase [Chloroflexota bacterium]
MSDDARLDTIEADWDRFYRDFPDIYDRFALSTAAAVPALQARYDFRGQVVIDVGSGTGVSTFALARYAQVVVGVEPWASMRDLAVPKLGTGGRQHVAFVNSAAECLPFRQHSADTIVSIWGFPFWFVGAGADGQELAGRFVAACQAIVKPGGAVVIVGAAPGCDAGELTSILAPTASGAQAVDRFMTDLGFASWDLDVMADYGSVSEAVETYGFIYGQRAIDHLEEHRISRIRWRLRVHEMRIGD